MIFNSIQWMIQWLAHKLSPFTSAHFSQRCFWMYAATWYWSTFSTRWTFNLSFMRLLLCDGLWKCRSTEWSVHWLSCCPSVSVTHVNTVRVSRPSGCVHTYRRENRRRVTPWAANTKRRPNESPLTGPSQRDFGMHCSESGFQYSLFDSAQMGAKHWNNEPYSSSYLFSSP